jgi:hypothetical protein
MATLVEAWRTRTTLSNFAEPGLVKPITRYRDASAYNGPDKPARS